MISNTSFVTMLVLIALISSFSVYSLLKSKRKLIHLLYGLMSASLVVWMMALCAIKFVDPSNKPLLFILDTITNPTASLASVSLLWIAVTFANGYTEMPARYKLLIIPPIIFVLIVATNPLHHLHYRVFSVVASEVVFGPHVYIVGVYNYVMLLLAAVVTLRFGLRSTNKLYLQQALIFSIGILVPGVVNLLATLKVMDLSIVATPMSFAATVVCHSIAIFYLNFLNIKPIALQRILDNTSDCYLIIADDGMVVNYNKSFVEAFGHTFGIETDMYIATITNNEDPETRVGIYNLLTSIEASRQSRSMISYEQSLILSDHKNYYVVEISPLFIDDKIAGFVVMFKDVTTLRENMRREQDNMTRMMERERLASLGQMIGGIAHNLKTPIMSVSGSVGALEKLTEEYLMSVGDPDVTAEDNREIASDMRGWLTRIQDCCAYMSDLITTVKGLAANMNTSTNMEFSLDELFKRVYILMQHELMRGGLMLITENNLSSGTRIDGDINNLVQVINNLISNAIDAMKDKRGGKIILRSSGAPDSIVISVIDRGSGIPPDIKPRLFREMTTSKGAMGTGLGLFISNSLIRGKFGGRIWFEDNPEGGTIFNVSISTEGMGADQEHADNEVDG